MDLPVRSPWCSAATYLVSNCYVSVGIDDGSGVEKGWDKGYYRAAVLVYRPGPVIGAQGRAVCFDKKLMQHKIQFGDFLSVVMRC